MHPVFGGRDFRTNDIFVQFPQMTFFSVWANLALIDMDTVSLTRLVSAINSSLAKNSSTSIISFFIWLLQQLCLHYRRGSIKTWPNSDVFCERVRYWFAHDAVSCIIQWYTPNTIVPQTGSSNVTTGRPVTISIARGIFIPRWNSLKCNGEGYEKRNIFW